MPKGSSGGGEPFNLDKLRELIEMMEQHDVTEVSLRRGDEQWRLRRGARDAVPMMPVPPAAALPPPASAPPADSKTAEPADGLLTIESPTVGTFYSAPSPDDPSFVTAGSRVGPDSIVCIVEAMKVFNQIPAEVNGTIVEVLVNNGDPVEFGQPLFRVRPG